MTDRSVKEPQSPKEQKRSSQTVSSINPKWVIAAGVALAVVLYGFYYASAHKARDLADITRPPVGFEAFEEVDEDSTIGSDETADSFRDSSSVFPDSEEEDETAQLRLRVEELAQLNYEKDHLIVSLTEQLTEAQRNTPTTKALATEPSTSAGQRTHTVKKGETLSEIARLYYGSGTRWKEIYDANSEKLGDKNRVRVGTVLVIPE